MYRKIHIDFQKDEYCYFCNSNKLLKKGILLIDTETNERYISSLTCIEKVKNEIYNYEEKIPDLTRGIISLTSNSTGTTKNPNNELVRIMPPLEYLILRQNKLQDFKGISYSKIEDIYQYYSKYFIITPQQEKRLLGLIQTTKAKFPHLSPRNLQKVYAASYWLNYSIEKQYNKKYKDFLVSVLQFYKTRGFITTAQEEYVQKILEWLNDSLDNKFKKVPKIEFPQFCIQ